MFAPSPRGPVQEPEDLLDWMGIEGPLSLVDLIRAGSLEPRLAAILWTLLSRRSSIVVAAAPRLAGKSTTLAALLAMAPPETGFFPIGNSFSREMVRGLEAGSTYLVVNEVSPALPHRYLWGHGVEEVLQARAEGFSLALTLHAPSVMEVVNTFAMPPLSLSPALTRGLDVILVLRSGADQGRGVESLAVMEAGEETHLFTVTTLAQWNAGDRTFLYATSSVTAEALAQRSGLTPDEVERELAAREAYVAGLVDDPSRSSSGDLRQALARFSSG